MDSYPNILKDFQQSPFIPLGKHMAFVKECVDLVEPMFDCVRNENYDCLADMAKSVFKAEHNADQIKNEIRRAIPKTFDLPVFRGDLLAFLKQQDDIADSAEDIAVVLTIKKLPMPKGLADDVMEYVMQVCSVCDLIFKCTDQLADLSEADFRGPNSEQMVELIARADQAEWESDKLGYKLAQKLFALEDEIKATDIFLWSNVFRELGALANHADKTGDRLRRMMAS